MNRYPESKLPEVGTTIFTVMSRLASECEAINLSQGFPSFDPPQALRELVAHYVEHGNNQYAPMPGVPALCEAIADKVAALQGRRPCPESEVTVTSGATEGLFSAIQALVRPGDEVIVFDPAYDSYAPAVRLAGGRTVHVPLTTGRIGLDYEMDWQRLEDAIANTTRLVVCNFPHNPTGMLLGREDLDRLADIVRGTDVLLLADEVYEHIVFDGREHVSLLSHDELWPRSIVVSSFGKTFHATGWKVGYCIAPRPLTGEFRKVHQFTVFAVNTPVQQALADFLASDPEFYARLPGFYEAKRDRFCELLRERTAFRLVPARSTFFQLVDYSELSDEADTALAERWTREAGVASIPLSVFSESPTDARHLRFCFAKDDETLEDAVNRLSGLGR
jgi:methionine aminotransferase